jgi:hypothetical protein
MDLWYIANRQKGTLPKRFSDMNTVQIAREIDTACHAVRGDYTLPRSKDDFKFRGLGLDNHPDYPYRVELKDFPVRFEHDEEDLKTWIETPAGEVFTHIRQSREMLKDGISLPFVLSYPIRSEKDFEAVAQVFEHLEVVPTPERYRAFKERMGDQGVGVANGLHVASPIHFMLHDLIAMDNFYYLYTDSRDKMYELAERMEGFVMKALDAVLSCDCEAFLWGSNYDQNTTYPAFFTQEIKPWLDKVGARARAGGKMSVSHTDGENKELLGVYRQTDFQIAESVCTAPMTKYTLKEFRDGCGDKITTWGGIPAVALLEETMSEGEFTSFLDRVFGELGNGERLILGVSDNVPPEASLARMEEISRRIERFGPVRA